MAISRTSKGTASDKTSGTTLTLSSVSLNAGDLVFVAVASLGGITQQSAKWGDYSLTQYGVALNIGTSMSAALYYLRVNQSATRDIVVTWVSSIAARVLAAFIVDEASVLDVAAVNNNDDSTTAPDSGESFATTAEDDEFILGIWASNGPSGDTVGAVGYGMIGYQRIGTTGDADTTNVTLHEGSKAISTAAKIQAGKTGATSRDWISVALSFKARQTFTIKKVEQDHRDQNDDADWVWTKIEDESNKGFRIEIEPEIFDEMTDAEYKNHVRAACARWAERSLDDGSNVDEDSARDTRMAGFVNDTVII